MSFPRICRGAAQHRIEGPQDVNRQGKCLRCKQAHDAARWRKNRGAKLPTFTGKESEWKGKAEIHPWILRSARMSLEREQEALAALDLPTRRLDDSGSDAETRERFDAFVERYGLEHAGVDRVMSAVDRTRYDRSGEWEVLA